VSTAKALSTPISLFISYFRPYQWNHSYPGTCSAVTVTREI
jgi:hypothetical protein